VYRKEVQYMKKILLVLIFLLFILGCNAQEQPIRTLSDLEITACNTAHKAGTCDSRLPEIGIILKEDCCQILGKCC